MIIDSAGSMSDKSFLKSGDVLAFETSFEGQCLRLGYSDDAITNNLSTVSYLNRSLSLMTYTGNARCIIHDNCPTNAYKARVFGRLFVKSLGCHFINVIHGVVWHKFCRSATFQS
jgi:hypothetical protein